MRRSQVFLTQRQLLALAAIAKTTGKKRTALIREAVDRLIDQFFAVPVLRYLSNSQLASVSRSLLTPWVVTRVPAKSTT
jgi:hypothetical protein